ncbi:gamma-glutamyl hydrolase-like [Dendronephthya gigantea]|uniref:gamma-glutamyl hydrolase-like n=1 Tax=Dendronephthya gigantea TaxID=151771 RepID=UPI00106AD6CF|nr:gamma-glutamyl hydrolase-like [Dendronephthya gigantea]
MTQPTTHDPRDGHKTITRLIIKRVHFTSAFNIIKLSPFKKDNAESQNKPEKEKENKEKNKMKIERYMTVFLTLVFTCRAASRDNRNNRPIIGVMAQSTEGESFAKFGDSYIAASYIKYLESSGARVVPIMNDLNEEEAEKLFYSINGALFPGGGVSVQTSGYARIGKQFFTLAKKSYDKGDYFPVWGTCLGNEFLSVMASNDANILSTTDSENYTIPLNFSSNYRDSKLFRDISDDLAKFVSSAPTTINMHQYSVLLSKFKKNDNISKFFRILSTNNDRNGKTFVSTMEGIRYPIYGIQWHAEKNSFEWNLNENIPHQAMSIRLTQYMSNFFVNEARSSQHKFPTLKEEAAALIYNYSPFYTGNISNFEQCYIFKSKTIHVEH